MRGDLDELSARDADLLDGVENVRILLERDLDRIIERHVGHIRVALLGDEAGSDFSKSAIIIFCCIANFSLSLRVSVSCQGQRFVELARCWQRQIELVRKDAQHPEERA